MNCGDPLGLCGRTLDKLYEIEELADVGGFSAIYRARHKVWKRPCAVKIFDPTRLGASAIEDALKEAFMREATLPAELSSSSASVVQAWDVGSCVGPNGRSIPYVVLEWLDGRSLDEILDGEWRCGFYRWSLKEIHASLDGPVRALEIAHRRGIVHRDIKPENLFVIGEPRTPDAVTKLLDFGVAKVMDDPRVRAALARTGMTEASFTPHYGAPEQFDRSFGATGPWTDVFALGLVVTELIAGRRALSGDSVAELAEASSNRLRRPTPAVLGVSVPRAVEEVLARALAVEPSDRYGTAGELWDAFEQALEADSLTAVTLRNPTPTIDAGGRPPARAGSLLTEPSRRRKGAERAVRLVSGSAPSLCSRLWRRPCTRRTHGAGRS